MNKITEAVTVFNTILSRDRVYIPAKIESMLAAKKPVYLERDTHNPRHLILTQRKTKRAVCHKNGNPIEIYGWNTERKTRRRHISLNKFYDFQPSFSYSSVMFMSRPETQDVILIPFA